MSAASATKDRGSSANEAHADPDARYKLPLSWVGQTLRLSGLEDVDVAESLSALDLDARVSGTGDVGLGPAECMLLCLSLVNAVDDELHGLTRARMSRGTTAMAAKASASSTTLEGAVATLCRFYDLLGGHCRFALDRTADDAVLTISTEQGEGAHRALVEELLAHTVHMQLSHFFGALLPLTSFVTSSPLHPSIGRTHPYLLCPVVAGRTSRLAFPVELLAAQSRGVVVDCPVWEAGRFWLARHPATSGAISDDDAERPATSALMSVLKRDDTSIGGCSAELALSVPDLRRSLMDEGTTFRQVRRAALVERARPHLVSGAGVDDLAAALGYSDGRSFRRALKLATGLGIGDLRRDVRAAAPDRKLVMRSLRREMARLE